MSHSPEKDQPLTVEDLANCWGELRMMAGSLLKSERAGCSFTPSALAATALRRARLAELDWEDVKWENRGHFFHSLMRCMRHSLTDHARKRLARKRPPLEFVDPAEIEFYQLPRDADSRPERVLALEEALDWLGCQDNGSDLRDAVERHYFAGFSAEEIAEMDGLSRKTVNRRLSMARVLLKEKVIQLLTEAA